MIKRIVIAAVSIAGLIMSCWAMYGVYKWEENLESRLVGMQARLTKTQVDLSKIQEEMMDYATRNEDVIPTRTADGQCLALDTATGTAHGVFAMRDGRCHIADWRLKRP